MTVYLCLSAPKFPTFNRWLRLVLTSALDEMTDSLNPPPLPVCFMLDELATLGHLTTVENAVGLAAGYGIQLVSVFQDVAQMRDLYKGRWASFIGNAGVRALFNLDDYETAEYWSKFIGGSLVQTRSTQQDIYGYSQGDNVGETMRPLFPPEKIMMDFAAGKMLVLPQGAHPVITERVPYWEDTNLKGAWDDPRAPWRPPPVPPSPWRHESASSPPPPEPPPEPEKKQEWWQTGDLFPRYPNVVITTETKP
jgi:type IV secretion system protein VirD4